MKRIVQCFLLLSFGVGARAQLVSVSGSQLTDSSGAPVSNATITFTPVLASGRPASFRKGASGGQSVVTPVSATVTGGTFNLSLVDSTQTVPANICYAATVTDNVTGNSLLGPGYSCVQPSSTASWCAGPICNFDAFYPDLASMSLTYPATIRLGTVSTTYPGQPAQATITGDPAAAVLNLVLPQGAQGPIGTPTSGVNLTPSASQTILQPPGTQLTVNTACIQSDAINARSCFGARGDLQYALASCSISGASLSCPAGFTSADIGKDVYVTGAGPGGKSYQGTIVGTSSGAATISPAATAGVGSATAVWATDDTAALQAAFAAALAKGVGLYIPSGSYLHHGLNWTGLSGGRIYGDGFAATNLYAIAVTDPHGTPGATVVGIDISASSGGTIGTIALFGGFNAADAFGVPYLEDLAPAVNLFGGRVANTSGTDIAIKHGFEQVYTETSGPYDVVLYGYEQTDFHNSHFQVDSLSPSAALYLSGVNSQHFISPYVSLIASSTMTRVSISGAKTQFEGAGNMIVLDQGNSSAGVYQIAIRDAYAYIKAPASGSCSFISDTATATPGSSYIRDVTLDSVNIETNATTCQATNMFATAYQWRIENVQMYPTDDSVSQFVFQNGLLDSDVMIDVTGNPGSNPPMLAASSCMGTVLHTGELLDTYTCKDYASAMGGHHYIPGIASNGASVRPYTLAGYSTLTWVKLGTWVGNVAGDSFHLTLDISEGKLPGQNQQAFVDLAGAMGNTSAPAGTPNITGISGWAFGSGSPVLGVEIAATGGSTAPNNSSWDVWIQVQPYAFGTYSAMVADGATWTDIQTTAGTPPSAAGTFLTGTVYSMLGVGQAPIASSTASNYSVPIVIGGVTFYVRLSATP